MFFIHSSDIYLRIVEYIKNKFKISNMEEKNTYTLSLTCINRKIKVKIQ